MCCVAVVEWVLTMAFYRFAGVVASSVRGRTITYVGVDGMPGAGKSGVGRDGTQGMLMWGTDGQQWWHGNKSKMVVYCFVFGFCNFVV